MIAAGFHTQNDEWILTHKLRVLSEIADFIHVIIDRSPQSEAICRRFPKVQFQHWENQKEIGERDEHGSVTCEEGRMRQATWDACAVVDPKFILLGDTDEVFTPDVREFLLDDPRRRFDCFYVHTVNLFQSAYQRIGGESVYNFERSGSNKRGAIVRYIRGRDYRYDVEKTCHVRLEPNPVSAIAAIEDEKHRIIESPKSIHYKFANWPKWESSSQSKSKKYADYLAAAAPVEVDRGWLWRWRAEEILQNLPEPIAVVGNGPIIGNGAKIDSHASIIRFNNWITEGYEPHVGMRTDLWVTNCWEDVQLRSWTGEMMTTYGDGYFEKNVGRWLGMYPHMRLPSTDWIAEAKASTGRVSPSTGLTLLCKLRSMGKQFTPFGFSGNCDGHYWHPGPMFTTHAGEAGLVEKMGLGT
jgi:hypothetical protein